MQQKITEDPMQEDSNRENEIPEADTGGTAGTPEAEETDESSPDSGGPSTSSVEALQEALEEATRQAGENWDKYVRLKAEMDNMGKRSKRDLENAHKFAIEKFVNELLPVWDSLELGLDHADGGGIDPEKLVEGHELTLRMLGQVMEKFNVTQINPLGEPFDPELHEAMTTQPSEDTEPNRVLAVIQKGYVLNDRLIRPARVIVARAPDDE